MGFPIKFCNLANQKKRRFLKEMIIETSVNRVIILRFDSFQQQQQQSFEVQGGPYVPVLQKVVM